MRPQPTQPEFQRFQNKDEKHLPQILCCGIDMFVKQ